MTNTMKTAVSDVAGNLTDEQRRAIWTKYGISPANYVFVVESQKAVLKSAQNAMAKATEQSKEMEATDKLARANAIINAAYENMDSNGQPTAAGMQEAQIHLTSLVSEQLLGLNFTMQEISELVASKLIKDYNDEQVNANNTTETEEKNRAKESQFTGRARR